jgi:hypothetical protein
MQIKAKARHLKKLTLLLGNLHVAELQMFRAARAVAKEFQRSPDVRIRRAAETAATNLIDRVIPHSKKTGKLAEALTVRAEKLCEKVSS